MKNSNFHKVTKTVLNYGLFLCLISFNQIVSANSPIQLKPQVPGYHRMQVGDIEITALYDGYGTVPSSVFKGVESKKMEKMLSDAFLPDPSNIDMPINPFLINTGTNLILVDPGAAECYTDKAGKMLENLKAAGYQPEQIDTILLTHLHGDHVCGINSNGVPLFENATIYVPQAEAEFWLGENANKQVLPEQQYLMKMAQDALAPYIKRDKVRFFSPEQKDINGIKIIPTSGHTPGHTAYLVSSKGAELLLVGDLLLNSVLQLTDPNITFEFDVNAEQARISRIDLLSKAAKQKWWIAASHLPFPGIGHIRSKDKGFIWIPLEYQN